MEIRNQHSSTSYIESHEVDIARDFIKSHLNFNPIKALNKKIAVKIYVRPEELSTITTDDGRQISIYLPPSILANEQFKNCTALVISMSEDAYQSKEYQETGAYCRVGDWIVIPRNVGIQVNFRGIPVQIIPEDAIYCVIEDPTHIERRI